MQISLFDYERDAIDSVKASFSLDEEVVTALGVTLQMLRNIFVELTPTGVVEFRQGRLAVMGLTNHTQHLFVGGLDALAKGNAYVWSACLRGLIETFGACVLIAASPASAPNYLGDRIKAGKLRAAAESAQPGLGGHLDRLNSIVHPASGAVHAGLTVLNRENRVARFLYGYRVPSISEGREAVITIANAAALVEERIELLIVSEEVLDAGHTVMERAPEYDGIGA